MHVLWLFAPKSQQHWKKRMKKWYLIIIWEYIKSDNCVTMHILQLTLITGPKNYEQREPWTTTNEDNKTPFSLDQHEFPPIMKLVGVALETTNFASYPSKPRNCRGKLGTSRQYQNHVAGERLDTSHQSKPRLRYTNYGEFPWRSLQ